MGINSKGTAAPFICGYIGEVWGWHYGFSLAGIGMLAGVIVFWDGLKKMSLVTKAYNQRNTLIKKSLI